MLALRYQLTQEQAVSIVEWYRTTVPVTYTQADNFDSAQAVQRMLTHDWNFNPVDAKQRELNLHTLETVIFGFM